MSKLLDRVKSAVPGRGNAGAGGSKRARRVKLIVCIVVGVLLFVPALFVNNAIGYTPFLAYVLAVVLSYFYIRQLRDKLEFSANSFTRSCVRGESVEFTLTVSNKSVLPAVRVQALFFMSDLFGGAGATDIHNITLGPHRSKTYNFATRFDHIGTYHVGVKEVRVEDLLGIFSAVRENNRLTEVNVQPRIFDVGVLPIAKDATVEAKKNFSAVITDGVDYSGVREYRWGDPIKAIHWKLSARMPLGDYYTRMYETNANPGMAIVADFDAPEYTVEQLMSIYDTVVECAFSLAQYADVNGFDAELLFEDKAKNRRRYLTPFSGNHQEILERMPMIFSPGTGKDAIGLIQDEMNSVFAQSNLIVCTSVISVELAQTLIAARVGKRSPMLFAIIPEGIEEGRRKELLKLIEPLAAAGVTCRTISSATNLEQEG